MGDPRPIGIFDSGVGGLTVVRAVMDALPHESFVYFGDTARCPYGNRSIGEIQGFAIEIAEHLVGEDVKLILIACNAATSAALEEVAASAPVPVVGVIAPALRTAVRATRNGRVGLIGTRATVESGAYERALEHLGYAEVRLFAEACPRFVDFVEKGDTTSPELMEAARTYLAPLQRAGVDTLILGCTHYPLLLGALHHVMGPDVLLVSSAEETAKDVYEVLASTASLRDSTERPVHRFESSGDPELFRTLGSRFLGPEMQQVVHVTPQAAHAG